MTKRSVYKEEKHVFKKGRSKCAAQDTVIFQEMCFLCKAVYSPGVRKEEARKRVVLKVISLMISYIKFILI